MSFLENIGEIYGVMYGKYYDFLYKLTKKEKYLINWETPFYRDDVVFATPLIDEFPCFLYVPFDQEKGNEYFIVADWYSSYRCKKAAKLSLRRPEYFNGGIFTGKKNGYFLTRKKKR